MRVGARAHGGAAAGLAVISLLLPPGAVRPAAGETIEQYRARISRWSQALSRASTQAEHGGPAWRAAVEEVAREAGQGRSVERPEAGVLSVEHGWLSSRLSEALTARSAQVRSAALRLASEELGVYRASLSPPPPLDRRRLRAVLRRSLPPAPAARKLPLDWIRSLLARLGEWLDRLLSRLPSRWGATGSALFWVVLGVAAVVLALAVGLALRAVLRRLGRPAERVRPSIKTSPVWGPPDAEAAAGRAREAAAAGRYRDAIRHLYLSLLLRLDLAGLIRYHPARTNWEYLQALGGAASARLLQPMALFNGIFDRKWYGAEGAGRADYEVCERLYAELLAEGGAP